MDSGSAEFFRLARRELFFAEGAGLFRPAHRKKGEHAAQTEYSNVSLTFYVEI